MQAAAEDLLFHKYFTQSHVDAALNLSQHHQGIDRPATVMRNPDFDRVHQAGDGVALYLSYTGAETVRGRRPDTRAFIGRRQLGWLIAADRSEHAEVSLGQLHGLGKAQGTLRIRAGKDFSPAGDEIWLWATQPLCRHSEEQTAHFLCGFDSCVPHH